MLETILLRLKSPVVWASVVALFILIFNAYNLWPLIGINAEQFKEIIDALMVVLIGFGVLNNPTTPDKF